MPRALCGRPAEKHLLTMSKPKEFILKYIPANKKPWKVTVPGTTFNRSFPTRPLALKFLDTCIALQS